MTIDVEIISGLTLTTALLPTSAQAATQYIEASVQNKSLMAPLTPDAVATGFTTLLGALIGALLAYVFQRRFQSSLDRKSALVAGHRLMFTLLHQVNSIVLIQRDYVYEHLNDPARFISIPATPPYGLKEVLNLAELSFLLDSTEGRNVLHNFYIAQQNYIEAINYWNLRSVLHHEKVQPALAAMGLKPGAVMTEAQIELALGSHVYGAIINSTNGCIEVLKRTFQKLTESKNQTRLYLVKRFKTNDFLKFDYPETFGLEDVD
jgi:hypothetical protein